MVALLVTAAALNWYCGKNAKPEARSEYAGLSPDARYVGMQTCRGCHSGVHATFIHTGMGSSFESATKKKSAANFEGHPVVYDQHRDFYYHPYWEGDSLCFLEYRMEGADTVYSQRKKINFIVGSGQHTNSHLWQENGYVFQAPLTFYTQRGQWDLPPGFENGNNSRFGRIIGQECMNCHNAYPDFVAGSENKFNTVKNGIDCERCHGPGSIHVAEKSSGLLVDTSKYIDYSIVNPAKLPLDLQLDLCQRCHIQGNAIVQPGKSFFDFKPGMKLSEVMDVYMPLYDGSDDEHIMASHAERLRMSKCFLMSRAKADLVSSKQKLRPYQDALTCVTCHNPHVSVKETGVSHFNTTCANCHSDKSKSAITCKLSMEGRLQKQDNCVSCHMPLNNTTDIPHVSVHDHRIAVHLEKKESAAVKKFAGINCINNPNPSRRSMAEAYINYAEKFGMGVELLDSALKYLPPVTNPGSDADLLISVFYLRKDWSKVLIAARDLEKKLPALSAYDIRNAWTAYRVGEASEQLEDQASALKWYAMASELAPLNPQFKNKYAGSLLNNNQSAAALRIFEELTREHPYFAPAYSNYGYLLLTLKNDPAGAKRNYDKALALDPDYTSAVLNKAGLYLLRGDSKSALLILRKHLPHASDKEEIQGLIQRIEKGI